MTCTCYIQIQPDDLQYGNLYVIYVCCWFIPFTSVLHHLRAGCLVNVVQETVDSDRYFQISNKLMPSPHLCTLQRHLRNQS